MISNNDKKMILTIVDLHALTIPQKNTDLYNDCLNMASLIMACGINLETTLVYNQSQIPEHSELMWLLACHSPIGYLSRMPQWKEKSAKFRENSENFQNFENFENSSNFTTEETQETEQNDSTAMEGHLGLFSYHYS